MFNYADLVWGDKNKVSLMNDQQVLQNKATKITLNRPLYSSATDAIITLKWLNLEQHIAVYMFTSVLMALWITQWSYWQTGTFLTITQEIETCLD